MPKPKPEPEDFAKIAQMRDRGYSAEAVSKWFGTPVGTIKNMYKQLEQEELRRKQVDVEVRRAEDRIRCPVLGCTNGKPPTVAFCGRHNGSLPRQLRENLWRHGTNKNGPEWKTALAAAVKYHNEASAEEFR